MDNCIFCKIVRKEAKSSILFETDKSLAILTIDPISKGHALIIPKIHCENVSDAPDDVLCDVIKLAKVVGEAAKHNLGATGYNILNATGMDAQQSVFHLHFHVVPRYPEDQLNLWFHGGDRTE